MIRELMREFYNGHRMLVGDGAIIVLFIASIIVMLVFFPQRSRKIAPVFASVMASVGCAMAVFIKAVRTRQYHKRAVKYAALLFAVCLCVLTCAASGKMVFSRELSGVADNDLHIPDPIVRSMDAILSDSNNPKVLTMPGWGVYLKSYSSSFSLMYDDIDKDKISSFDEDMITVYTELEKNSPDMKKIAACARNAGCEYVILSSDIWPERPITQYGYELIHEDDGCSVYKEVMSP